MIISTASSKGRVYRLSGNGDGFEASVRIESPEEGVELVHIRLRAEAPIAPPAFRLEWRIPIVDVQGVWHPGAYRNRGLAADWMKGYASRLTNSAPVVSLYGGDGGNRLTFAFSDTQSPVVCEAGVHEETAEFRCAVSFFGERTAPLAAYDATVRIDNRPVPYYDALNGVQAWWAADPAGAPSPVPEAAREAAYSTWYSFHQAIEPAAIEDECRRAKALGCGVVIVDDGWQTANNARGYAYCGDWEACEEKMPDMAAHVARVRALGMKYMLWYSVPYVGVHSRAWETFRGKLLYAVEERGWGVLDPRFPEVREYLIGLYERAMREWKLDGFKLDFVDAFTLPDGTAPVYGEGRDYVGVHEAVDRLLSDVMSRLRAANPEVLIEFRQSYVGPNMRKYGNMFRAADCPNDAVENRARTLDIRLLCGDTAAHADMLMWHPDEPAESAALQLVNVLFAVPQLSVRLDRIGAAHAETVAFWLAFWREHRDTLLGGRLEPLHPELLYPLVYAGDGRKLIAAAYHRTVVGLGARELPETLLLVNGTRSEGVVLELDRDEGVRRLTVQDCRGRVVSRRDIRLAPGLLRVEVPPAGVASLAR